MTFAEKVERLVLLRQEVELCRAHERGMQVRSTQAFWMATRVGEILPEVMVATLAKNHEIMQKVRAETVMAEQALKRAEAKYGKAH